MLLQLLPLLLLLAAAAGGLLILVARWAAFAVGCDDGVRLVKSCASVLCALLLCVGGVVV